MSKGSGWKPALLVTVGKCVSICLRIKTMPPQLAGSQYQLSQLIAHYSLLNVVQASSLIIGDEHELPKRDIK